MSLRDLLPEEEATARARLTQEPLREEASSAAGKDALLVVDKLVKEYPRKGAAGFVGKMFSRKPPVETETFRAVDGISFSIARGESVGLVGESGCGKSTTSMMVMRLIDKTSGHDHLCRRRHRRNPGPQISPRCRCARKSRWFFKTLPTVSTRASRPRARSPIRCCALAARPRRSACRAARNSPTQVGLPLNLFDRFPHQLSGGQKARVGIARAIALKPDLVILDEPTAALDVSVQAVVLNLLQDLKDSLGMSYLFVSHDLNVVRLLCDRVIVMQAGKIVEQGPTERVMDGAGSELYARPVGGNPASAGLSEGDCAGARFPHELDRACR